MGLMEVDVTDEHGPGEPVGTARRARRHQQALREILDAAREEMRLHGPSGVTMRAVAKAVDMTPGGMYRHVSDHNELLGLLAADAYESVAEAMSQARNRAPAGDHATGWYLVAMAMRQWYLDHVPEFQLLVSPRLVDPLPERLLETRGRSVRIMIEVCSDAIEAGQLDPAASGFPSAALGGDAPVDSALPIAVSALAALSGHLGFEIRGAFAHMPMDPQQHYSAYVRSTMRLMGFVVEAGPLVMSELH